MFVQGRLLLKSLKDPNAVVSIGLPDWDNLIQMARNLGVLPRLAILLEDRGLTSSLPGTVIGHLAAAGAVAGAHERVMQWELNRLERALEGLALPVVLLKGAAYLAANLPPSRGRLYSDADIMVPRSSLRSVEEALLAGGWDEVKLQPYDRRYYRTWMHELPPYQHRDRHTVVDVHHTILPLTSRLKPSADLLFEAARGLERGPWKVLAPADMVLHSAAHMFQDGQVSGAVRDLLDLDGLLCHFGREAGFWEELVHRAGRLDLSRPLFYALRYSHLLLGTSVPEHILRASAEAAPARPVVALMDSLVGASLTGPEPGQSTWRSSVADWLLYVRSHALRMPPALLARHLFRKSLMRWSRRAA